MGQSILNKFSIGCLVLAFIILLNHTSIQAQESDRNVDFQHVFSNNLIHVTGTYPWNDSEFYPGIFHLQNDSESWCHISGNFFVSKEMPDFMKYCTFLNHLSTSEKQVLVKTFSYYENDFEQALKNAGLSSELKYLPATLSAMNNYAVSTYRRAGLWQLTHFQAVLNDLQENRFVDERLDVKKATKAAVAEIIKNKQLFNDDKLAVLAYVFGKTKIRNLCEDIEGEFTFEKFIKTAPENIVEFIAKFQAVTAFLSGNTYVVNDKKIVSAEVAVEKKIHFKQLAVLEITEKQLAFYNPQYRFAIVPKGCSLQLPPETKNEFMTMADSVYNAYDSAYFAITVQHIEYPPEPVRQYVGVSKDLHIAGKEKLSYTIKSGDVLGTIAEKFDVKVADLRSWNNISNPRRIRAGQKLSVFVDKGKTDEYAENYKKVNADIRKQTSTPDFSISAIADFTTSAKAKKVEHIVKSGESPYTIAKQYKGVTSEDILKWNNIKDARKIQIGQKLIIYIQ